MYNKSKTDYKKGSRKKLQIWNCKSQKYFRIVEMWQDGKYSQPVVFTFKAVQETFKVMPYRKNVSPPAIK